MRLRCAGIFLGFLLIVPAACLVRVPAVHPGAIGSAHGHRHAALESKNLQLPLAVGSSRALHLRGGDDDDANEEEEGGEEGQAEDVEQTDVDAETGDGGVIPPLEESSYASVIPQGSVVWDWWKWRDSHLKEAIILEVGMITCPRATFLIGPLLEKSLWGLLKQDGFSSGASHALRVALCTLCPKALLLPALLKDPTGLAIFGIILLHCIDDVMSLITSPVEILSSEFLHALGALVLIGGYELLPADPLSAMYARQASMLLYLDWAALFYLLLSPCMRAFSFVTLLFR